MFSMKRSFFLYVSLNQIMKRIQLPSPCFYERAFSYFSCLELYDFTPFKPNFFEGGSQTPSLTHLQYQNYRVIYVYV